MKTGQWGLLLWLGTSCFKPLLFIQKLKQSHVWDRA